VTTVAKVLEPLVSALETDGYSAVITESEGQISFEIVAGPEACEECLSPRKIIEPMILGLLRSGGFDQILKLTYPTNC
jgi:hypothetical protein